MQVKRRIEAVVGSPRCSSFVGLVKPATITQWFVSSSSMKYFYQLSEKRNQKRPSM